MSVHALPPADEMYRAFLARDASYEGLFYTAVKTTGIFCRPSCPAKKPRRENITFYQTPDEALRAGYRPCKRCAPLEPDGQVPPAIEALLDDLDADPSVRVRDADLRARGLDPVRVRRWFKKHHHMTFHAYQRSLRLGRALRHLGDGSDVTQVAFESGYDSLSGFQDAIRQLTGRTPSESRGAVVVAFNRILTPLGPMLAGTTPDGVCLLEFTDRRMLETQLTRLAERLNATFVPGPTSMYERLAAEVAAYFAGTLHTFTLPLVAPGTPFQEKVWAALRAVPYGQTRSYGALAEQIEAPRAVRAVARANGDNRLALLLPCHRVVGADGALTGYGGGLWRKRWLLRHEGAAFKDDEAQTELAL